MLGFFHSLLAWDGHIIPPQLIWDFFLECMGL